MATGNEPRANANAPSLKVVGVGGAGLVAIAHMAATDLGALPFAAVHTNARALAGAPGSEKIVLGSNLIHGLGTGGDPALGKAAAEEEILKLRELSNGADLVFVVAGLGGGTGGGAGPVIARTARESGALVLALVTSPFEFEGARRHRQAQQALQQFKASADAVLCLSNQRVLKLIDENTPVTETFARTNALLTEGVRSLWQMLTRPGLIQVDFFDLCSVLRGRHSESAFANATAEGEGRAREVMEKLLTNPLLDGGQMLADADAVLVSLMGGADLTMAEVNRVMEQINRRTETANLVMGAAVDPALGTTLSVTLIASRRNQPLEKSIRPVPEAAVDKPESTGESGGGLDTTFLSGSSSASSRPGSRFVPPAPVLTVEQASQLLEGKTAGSRGRKSQAKLRQGQLPLEIISKGRFEKSEPTIHHGEDLDVPTYIRRGVPLN